LSVQTSVRVPALMNIATRLRIDSVRSTSEAGSGHPSTCCSAAEIVAALFFAEMRYDPRDPQNPDSDRFVLSKGHAAPLLYAAWAEAGLLKREDLLALRRIDSDLEGHPTPRLSFVDVATGSLGQGLCAGVGIALNARLIGSDYRTYVLLGDGETADDHGTNPEIGDRLRRVAKRAERTDDGHVDLDEGAWGKADAGRSPPRIRLRSSAGNGIVR